MRKSNNVNKILTEFNIAASKAVADTTEKKKLRFNPSLHNAIDDTISAWDELPKYLSMVEQEILKDKNRSVDVTQIEYQKNLTKIQLERAVGEAKRRREYFANIRTQEDVDAEIEKCKSDPLHWFKTYCWTEDPRNSELGIVPFKPFEFQEELWEWLFRIVFVKKGTGLCDKSRTMGVSWVAICFSVYNWLFSRKRSPFKCLMSSRKEQYVDELGNMDSLLEKVRFCIRFLPPWMLPENFSEDWMAKLKIINYSNGAIISGESSNEDIGRGGRKTVAFFDEFAAYPDGGYAAWTSISQTAYAKIAISTPKGLYNQFANLRFNPATEVKTFHWSRHPFYNDIWYEVQKAELKNNPEMIAQELDIDYTASQSGKVYPQWSPSHHIITQSEFCKFFDLSSFHIPNDFRLVWSQDWGASRSDPAATIWAAIAPENSPLRGSVFIYRTMTDISGSPLQLGKKIVMAEKPWDESRRMYKRVMSHDAKGERNVYAESYYMNIEIPKLAVNEGIAKVGTYLELRDKDKPHPFRPTINGRPMVYIVVNDSDGYFTQSVDGKWNSTGVENSNFDFIRAIGSYHYPESEAGKSVNLKTPKKVDDHYPDALRYLLMLLPDPQPTSPWDKREEFIPNLLKLDNIKNIENEDEKGLAWISRQSWLEENKDKVQGQVVRTSPSILNIKPDSFLPLKKKQYFNPRRKR